MKKLYMIILFMLISFNSVIISQSWHEQTSGVTVQLTSASTIDFFRGWICGYNGTVLRTTTSGNTWVNVSGNGIPNTVMLINIYGFDLNSAITAGYIGTNTFVYRTTNGGANWQQVFTETNGFINAIWMSSLTNGFMTGDPVGGRWSLWKTTNGGANWDSTGLYLPRAGSEAGWNNSLFIQNQSIWFGTNNSRIYYSTNLGATWSVQPTSPEINVYTIYVGSSIAWAGGATLLKSTNLGTNWSQISAPGTGNFGGIIGQGPCVWYLRNPDVSIYFSNTGGTTWVNQYTAPSGTYRHLSHIRTPGSTSNWAVRNNGGITSSNMIEVGINPITGEVPSEYSLSQNYPNPFNPATKIRFDIPLGENSGADNRVSIIVFDVIGRQRASLVNEQIHPGAYEIEWDASDLPSGVYFYKMISGNFTKTNKMILLK